VGAQQEQATRLAALESQLERLLAATQQGPFDPEAAIEVNPSRSTSDRGIEAGVPGLSGYTGAGLGVSPTAAIGNQLLGAGSIAKPSGAVRPADPAVSLAAEAARLAEVRQAQAEAESAANQLLDELDAVYRYAAGGGEFSLSL